jgi:putative DNA primase/helicase
VTAPILLPPDDPEVERALAALSADGREAAAELVRRAVRGSPILGTDAMRRNVWLTAASEARRATNPSPDEAPSPSASLQDASTTEPHLTDKGNSERLVRLHGADLLYCYELGKWLVWNGKRWAPDETGEVDRRAKETADFLYAQAIGLEDADLKRAFVKHALNSEDARRLNAMSALARSARPVRIAELDTHLGLLNTESGVVDLSTGALRPHDRDLLLTRIAPTIYSPDAESKTLRGFLEKFIEDEGEREFLARAAGYSLVGTCAEETLFLAYGPTWSGKSTFLRAFYATLGDVSAGGYAATTPFKTFLRHRNDDQAPRNDLARLVGARLVFALEVAEGQAFDAALIKSITGRDPVTARYLFKEWFSYVPQFTVWLGANTRPALDADDPALVRRVAVVPFPRGLSKEEVDPKIKERLCRDPEERTAFLAWAVRGSLAYRSGGLRVPAPVERETSAYFAENDTIGGFISARLDFGPGKEMTAGLLRSEYEEFCKGEGKPPESTQKMGARLRAHAAVRGTDRWHTWRGVALREDGNE